MAHAVIAVAARHGDAQLYNQFKEQMQKASSPEQYYGYFYALSLFPQPDLTKETLDSTLTPAVRGQDLYILIPLLRHPQSQDETWSFMQAHFDDLMKKTGGGLGGVGVFLYGAQSFCDAQKAARGAAVLPAASLPRHRAQPEAGHRVDQQLRAAARSTAGTAVGMAENAERRDQRFQR